MLFISHNLAVIAKMCDRVGVLYAGRLVEEGPARAVFDDPRHPYTVGLLRCIPRGGVAQGPGAALTRSRASCRRSAPSSPGCVFADRCGLAEDICRERSPPLFDARRRAAQPLSLPRAGADAAARRAAAGETPSAAVRTDRRAAVLSATESRKTFHQDGHESARSPTSRSRSARARRSAWSASRAAARRRSRGSLLGLTSPDEGRASSSTASRSPPPVAQRSPEQVRALQIVFQNPDSALNRRFSVRRIIGRALTKLLATAAERDDGSCT